MISLPYKSVGWSGLCTATTPAIAHYSSPYQGCQRESQRLMTESQRPFPFTAVLFCASKHPSLLLQLGWFRACRNTGPGGAESQPPTLTTISPGFPASTLLPRLGPAFQSWMLTIPSGVGRTELTPHPCFYQLLFPSRYLSYFSFISSLACVLPKVW